MKKYQKIIKISNKLFLLNIFGILIIKIINDKKNQYFYIKFIFINLIILIKVKKKKKIKKIDNIIIFVI
jgi:hypothetical protein